MAVPLRILVIDDDVLLLRAIKRTLKPLAVTTVASPSDAFIELAKGKFDVILCDVHMPGMSGPEFVSKLSPLDAGCVVFMTGAEKVSQEHADVKRPMIFKPFTKEHLLEAITTLMLAAA